MKKSNVKYIIISPKKDNGTQKRAIFIDPRLRTRYYRLYFKHHSYGLVLASYKRKSYAQGICDAINKNYKDDFKVVKLVERKK